jgi:hypothetical protein
MTTEDRVIDTVITWSGVDDFLGSDPLENIWARSDSASGLPFHPQAVTDLIDRLRDAFSPPFVPARDLSSFTPPIFAPVGGINTVDDLITQVMAAPSAQAEALAAAFSDESALDRLAETIASKVAEKLKKALSRKSGRKKATKATKRSSGKKKSAKASTSKRRSTKASKGGKK